jgi:hypothetical protein
MTRTEYGVKVTELLDAHTGGEFEYMEGFDSDVDAYFLNRLSPEEAAAKLLEDYWL